MSVMTSSLVGWMTKSRSCRSFTRSSSGPIGLEAPGLLPQLGRLDHRHQQLDGAGAVHLLADDRLDLADHPQAHRHVAVDAGASRLIRPARIMSRWLTISASAGASLRVEMKNWRGFHGA